MKCSECGEHLAAFVMEGGKIYCPACYEKLKGGTKK